MMSILQKIGILKRKARNERARSARCDVNLNGDGDVTTYNVSLRGPGQIYTKRGPKGRGYGRDGMEWNGMGCMDEWTGYQIGHV